MGSSRAREIASEDTTIEQQLKYHFSGNCYPPIPYDFIPLAVDSIQRYWDAYNFDKSELIHEAIDMPIVNGQQSYHRGNTYTTAYDVVEWLRLHAWLEDDDGYGWFEDDY